MPDRRLYSSGHGRSEWIETGLLERFLEHCESVETMEKLHWRLEHFANAVGFDFVALTHHADLSMQASSLINVQTYPEAWARRYIERRMHLIDPIPRVSLNRLSPFRWDDPHTVQLDDARDIALMSAAADAGIGNGFTVPTHIPGECPASCNFALSVGKALPPGPALEMSAIAGRAAFQAARRIVGLVDRRSNLRPILTPQQRQCALYAARGKSAAEIGVILGLSDKTVGNYLRAAMRRYDVYTRTGLAMQCIRAGEFSSLEVFDGR